MDAVENQETVVKDGRGKPPELIRVGLWLMDRDIKLANDLSSKRTKQTNEDITRDRVIAEALQHYHKALSGQS